MSQAPRQRRPSGETASPEAAPRPARGASGSAPRGVPRATGGGRGLLRCVSQRGTTLIELVVTAAVLAILATAILPVAAASQRREKEIQLRRTLREIRQALDTYHVLCLQSVGGGTQAPPAGANGDPTQVQTLRLKIENDPDQTCWPKDLDVLIEGVETNVPRHRLKFLRRIPEDPFNVREDEHDQHGWRLRASTDRPDSESWDRRNVMDVYSGSDYRALDGSRYEDW